MIDGKKVLAIIPARGGSKGLPKKNLIEVNGKPLIAWTIEQAKKSTYIDRLILSSDDDEIIATGEEWGCESPFKRPMELATDEAIASDLITHAIQNIKEKYDYTVLLQPTSPLRAYYDIDKCIEKCIQENATSCVTVSKPDKSPFWMYHINNNKMRHVITNSTLALRRQDLPPVYALNGAVYVVQTEWFLINKVLVDNKTIAYKMPKERSIDIDDKFDLHIFRAIVASGCLKEN